MARLWSHTDVHHALNKNHSEKMKGFAKKIQGACMITGLLAPPKRVLLADDGSPSKVAHCARKHDDVPSRAGVGNLFPIEGPFKLLQHPSRAIHND